MKRRLSFKEGDLVKVPINEKEHTYMRVIVNQKCAFYDGKSNIEREDFSEIMKLPVIFTITIYHSDLKEGDWSKKVNFPLESFFKINPPCFIKNILPPGAKQTYRILENGLFRAAQWEECKNLEPCEVYAKEHVVKRLNDFYYGDRFAYLRQYLAHTGDPTKMEVI